MPFRAQRKTYRKKRGATSWYNRKYSPLQIASKALHGVKYLKGLVNAELKFFDTKDADTGEAFSWDGLVAILSSIPAGDSGQTRDGNSILAKSSYLQAVFTKHASATITQIRVILFLDKEYKPNSQIAATDILEESGHIGATICPMNQYTGHRFKILQDKRFTLTTDRPSYTMKLYHKLNTHFKFTSSYMNDQVLGYLFITNEETNTPHVIWWHRLRYYDN